MVDYKDIEFALENYRSRYADKDLCTSLKELYTLYYLIAKEENLERYYEK
ncbi:16607_t:CDS:2, partial [Funneliformis mosseae]